MIFLLLVTAIAVSIIAWHLAGSVRSDGYGSNPAPRSHLEELDAWARR